MASVGFWGIVKFASGLLLLLVVCGWGIALGFRFFLLLQNDLLNAGLRQTERATPFDPFAIFHHFEDAFCALLSIDIATIRKKVDVSILVL
jgi:hypothetical protein